MKGATKPTNRVPLPMSTEIARHIETFSEYSKLSGIPLNDLLEECFSEYIKSTVEPSKS